jgi:hypothetical protein
LIELSGRKFANETATRFGQQAHPELAATLDNNFYPSHMAVKINAVKLIQRESFPASRDKTGWL